MRECLTKPLTKSFSGCLVENPTCEYAVRFGLSYQCKNPRHKEFFLNAPSSAAAADLDDLYWYLKNVRRKEYSVGL